MGRKIPAKKHRGVKDPVKQQARRFQSFTSTNITSLEVVQAIERPLTSPRVRNLQAKTIMNPRTVECENSSREGSPSSAGTSTGCETPSVTGTRGPHNRRASLVPSPSLYVKCETSSPSSCAAGTSKSPNKRPTAAAAQFPPAKRCFLKGKINLAPSDPDEQPVPRSIERMFGLKPQSDKADKKKKLKHIDYKEDKPTAVASKKRNPISRLKRAVGETGRAFSARISNAVRTLVADADMLEYPLDTEKEDVKGNQVAEWKERRRAKQRKIDKQNGKTEQDGEKKKKLHRLDLKKAARKAKADEHAAQSRELVYERVQFGDVAAAPPALCRPRRAAPRDAAPRPGARDLLLTKLLNPANQQSPQTPNSQSQASKGKKPQLSAIEKERRERARVLAVEAYRQLKKGRERKQDS